MYAIYILYILINMLSMAFLYMVHHSILLWLNPFDLRGDKDGWLFENSCAIVAGFFVSTGS